MPVAAADALRDVRDRVCAGVLEVQAVANKLPDLQTETVRAFED